MRPTTLIVVILIGAAACITPVPTLAESAWISPAAQYPDGFAKKKPKTRGQGSIHGDGSPVEELTGLIDGFNVSVRGPGEDARGWIEIESDYQKIAVKKGWKSVPLDWTVSCDFGPKDQNVTCTVERPIYGSKQEDESRFEVRGPQGPICILKNFTESLGAKVAFDQVQMATDRSGCLSQADSIALLDAIGEGGKTVVIFDTPNGARSSNLAGLSAVVQMLRWLQENSIRPTKEMLLNAYEQRFIACGLLGGELSARTNVRLTKFLDTMISQHFDLVGPLADFGDDELRMKAAFLKGATKYQGQESKAKALEYAYRECTDPGASRYLFGWGLTYP